MTRVFVVTLGFANPATINASMERLYSTRALEFTHVLVDQHFPLPSEAACSLNLLRLTEQYRCSYLNPGYNLGLASGFNYAVAEMRMKPEDIVIGFDPDCMPVTPGWDDALFEVLACHPDVGWASLGNDVSEREMRERGFETRAHGGSEIWLTQHAVVNSICAWRVSWLQAVGGLQEPNKYYGGLESRMFPLLAQRGYRWAFLPAFREERHEPTEKTKDPEYRDYKIAHAHTGEWKGDFKSFLESRKNS